MCVGRPGGVSILLRNLKKRQGDLSTVVEWLWSDGAVPSRVWRGKSDRRTCASSIQRILRHANMHTTRKSYIKVSWLFWGSVFCRFHLPSGLRPQLLEKSN